MKSIIAVAAFAGLAAAWGPQGTWTSSGGSWGHHTGTWGSETTVTAAPTAPTTYSAWNSTTVGPTATASGASSGTSVYHSTGSPIATGGVDSAKPMVGGLLAIAGLVAAL